VLSGVPAAAIEVVPDTVDGTETEAMVIAARGPPAAGSPVGLTARSHTGCCVAGCRRERLIVQRQTIHASIVVALARDNTETMMSAAGEHAAGDLWRGKARIGPRTPSPIEPRGWSSSDGARLTRIDGADRPERNTARDHHARRGPDSRSEAPPPPHIPVTEAVRAGVSRASGRTSSSSASPAC
jgi:hypothetical protein